MTRKMKSSGSEWIGEIPEDWEVNRVKNLFKSGKGLSITKENLIDAGLAVVSYGQIHSKSNTGVTIKSDLLRFVDFKYKKYNPQCQVYKYDFIFADTSEDYEGCGNCVYKRDDSLLFAGYHSIILHSIEQRDNRYYAYLFKTDCWRKQIREVASGVKLFTISQKALVNSSVIVPPFEQQQNIANYLDKKYVEIDALLSDIQLQISILEDYKKSVITEAVTKGLNPDVEMKDSGIEWIGEVSEKWDVNRVKNMFTSGKGLSITKENLIDEGLAVVSYGQIHSKTNTGVTIEDDLFRFVDYKYQKYYPQCQVYQYDFIFADTSEDSDGCGNCVYKRDKSILFAGYHSIILHSIIPQDNRYLAYLFKTDCWRKQIREMASGVKVLSITQKTLINSSVTVPPFEEQQKIADYLDKKCAEIEGIIVEKKKQLEVLEQYKKSLIYEYVTGKKEVIKND